MTKSTKMTLLLTLCIAAATSVQAALQIDNAAVTNAGRTNAEFRAHLVSTNATNATITLYYGLSDGTTNAADWANSNVYGTVSTGYYSTNITGLTPASIYYYRWYAIEGATGSTDWADSTTNIWTSAGVPTNTPATDSHAVMVDTNGNLLSPTNLWDRNGVAKTHVTDALLSTQIVQQATQDALVITQALQQTTQDALLSTQIVQQITQDALLSTQIVQQATQDAIVTTQGQHQVEIDDLWSSNSAHQVEIDNLVTTQAQQQATQDALLSTQANQQATQDALQSTQALQQTSIDGLLTTQSLQQATQDALVSTQATHTAEISGLQSTQALQIAVSPEYLAWSDSGGSGIGGTVIVTSDLLTNGYASSDYDTSGGGMTPWTADVEISTNGVDYAGAYPTTNQCYIRVVVGDGADDTAIITNIQIYSWSRPDLYGEVRDTRGQDVRVDSPDTGRSAANKTYVDQQVGANNPSDWAEYDANDTVHLNGYSLYLCDQWNISQTGGVGVISYGDVWATTNKMVLSHNGWPMLELHSGLSGLTITNFSIGETNGTLWVSTNGVTSDPLPQWTDSLDQPEWQTLGSYTSTYPTVTNDAYKLDFTLPAGDTIFLRAVQESGDGEVKIISDMVLESGYDITVNGQSVSNLYNGLNLTNSWVDGSGITQEVTVTYGRITAWSTNGVSLP